MVRRVKGVTKLLLIMALFVPIGVTALPREASAAVPAGFSVTSLPTGIGQYDLTDFEFTPEGGWFSAAKSGKINWTSATGAVRTVKDLTAVTPTNGDSGLTAVALAADYATSPAIYTVRANRANGIDEHVVSRWQVQLNNAGEPVGLGAETRLVSVPMRYTVHVTTDVLVGPDGSLWITVGDYTSYERAEPRGFDTYNPDQPYGKLLRINSDGSGVTSNPYYDAQNPQSWRSRVYATGFRSPFRVRMHPTLNLPIVGDVGWNTTEEIDVVRPGGNYGWPCFEGPNPTPEYRDMAECAGAGTELPLFSYNRSAGIGTSVTGGMVYQGTDYPQQYRGTYFWGDYSGGKVMTLRINDTGTDVSELAQFSTTDGAPVSFKPAPNGDVTFADIASGKVKRIRYGAAAPDLSVQYATTPSGSGGRVEFTATSADPTEVPGAYRWDFGDGTPEVTGPAATVAHEYAAAGPYAARVTATYLAAEVTRTLTVYPANHSPRLDLTTPPDSTLFAVGDEIRLQATVTDPDEAAPLPVTWTTTLRHCTGEFYCHMHPGASATGPQYVAPFVDHGDSTTMIIRAEATDSVGATVSRSWVARPKLRTLTLTSNMDVPFSVNGMVGSTRSITVGSDAGLSVPARLDGNATFTGWSDGASANVRTLRMPDADVTLTATFESEITRRYAAEPALRTVLGAPIGPEIALGDGRMQAYQHGQLHSSAGSGVHEVRGGILDTYLAQGGRARLGAPTSDETPTADGAGRYSTFAGTAGVAGPRIFWSPQTPASLVLGPIGDTYSALGSERGTHGYPTSNQLTTPDGRALFNRFQNGAIYQRVPGGQAHSVRGAIYQRWAGTGWETGPLGLPITSEAPTAPRPGYYSHFEGGSVFWSATTGAHETHGGIGDAYRRLGYERSALGFPTTDEAPTGDRSGYYNHFETGSIFWSPTTGAHETHGAIGAKYAALGYERSPLGYPATDEAPTAGNTGYYNHFRSGSIFWSPTTGAHETHGGIRDTYAGLGYERSRLGFPISDEYVVPGGWRSDFQGGSIEYRADGQVIIG